MKNLEELTVKLGIVRRGIRMYRYALLASIVILATALTTIPACSLLDIRYPLKIQYMFTALVSLVAVDIVSMIFLAMWLIESIEFLEQYVRFCYETGKCIGNIIRNRAGLIGLVDYPLWSIILYVVSVTFATSAAYIIMVLVKYGRLGGQFPYSEGVLASSLLYVLGLVLGAVSSLVIVLVLARLGEYIGVSVLNIIGLVFSTKYLVDIASLVFNVSVIMCLLSIGLTIASLYLLGRIEKGIGIAEKYLAQYMV